MKKFSLLSLYHPAGGLLILYALLLYPVSGMLPDWASFENGPIENAQVLLLLLCGGMCVWFARHTLLSPAQKIWLPSAGIFLILALRELSWGRVFFIRAYSEAGEPILISSSEMPFYTAIHACVGFIAVLCLYFLVRFVPWKHIFKEIPFPWIHFLAIIICIVLTTLGDHHSLFHTIRDQQIEELAELLMYALLGHTAWYYYLKLEGGEK